jgi:hypothetical protein
LVARVFDTLCEVGFARRTALVTIPALSVVHVDLRTDLVMDTMDRLFELYNSGFDRLEQNVQRLNQKLGASDVNKMWAKRFTRQQFDEYLAETTPNSEARRLFVESLLEGHEDARSSLPNHLAIQVSGPQSIARSQSVA